MLLRRNLLMGIILASGMLPLAAGEPTEAKKASPTGPIYSLPYAPGTEHLVGLGYFEIPTHLGQYAVDWEMPEETPILAVHGGVVTEVVASYAKSGLTEDMKRKANYVVIRHDDGSYAIYVHLAQDGAKVKPGQRVEEGQEIALSGNTGFRPRRTCTSWPIRRARQLQAQSLTSDVTAPASSSRPHAAA